MQWFSAQIYHKGEGGVCVGIWSEFGTKKVDQNAKQIKVQVVQYLETEASQVMPALF